MKPCAHVLSLEILAGLMLLFVSSACWSAQAVDIPANSVCASSATTFVAPCRSLRARLQRGFDNMVIYIWPVGTARFLAVPGFAACELPPNVASQLTHSNVLYANIVVRPLSKEMPLHMQYVCIASASHVVIRDAPY